MLSVQENEYLTRTGPGTPMGELFRRFWLPVFLSEELPADGAPLRTRLLSEDLVGFRDTNGTVGLVAAFCPHRRAPMFFGRNEECGLRCVYHGWKFDHTGACVDMPSEPPESNFKDKVRISAYPTYEVGGLIWAYLGPADKQPSRPPMIEWTELPPARRRVSKWFHENNYMQGIEGDIDTAHVTYLHSDRRPKSASTQPVRADVAKLRDLLTRGEQHPRLTVMETDYGFVYGGRRRLPEGNSYWRVTQWLLPCFSLIPGQGSRGATAWIPVDDEHCTRYTIGMSPDADFEDGGNGPGGFLGSTATQFTLRDGTVIDTMIPPYTRHNLYEIDRALQKAGHYTGIMNGVAQDKAMIEGMGNICDRSEEHLGTSDLAVIAARRRLINLARELEKGIEPFAPSHPEAYRVRPLDILSPEPEFARLLEEHREETLVPA